MADIVIDVVTARVLMGIGRSVTIIGDLGGKVPKAVMIYGGTDTVESSGDEDNGNLGIGWSDGLEASSISIVSIGSNAVNDSSVSMRSESGAGHSMWHLIDSAGVRFVQFEFDEFVENGVKFTVTDPDTNFTSRAMRELTFVFFAGDDLQAHVDTHDLGNTTSAVGKTGVGFEPDVVLTMMHGFGLNVTSTLQSRISIGAVTNDGVGGIDHRSMFLGDDDSSAGDSNEEYGWMSDTGIVDVDGLSGTLLKTITLQSFDSDGFDTLCSVAASNDVIGFLCLEFGGESFDLSTYTIPATEGDVVTNVGFTPRAGFLFGSNSDAMNSGLTTLDTDQVLGINAFTNLNNNSSYHVRYGTPSAGTLTIRRQFMGRKLLTSPFTGNTEDGAVGELQSFDALGITINWGRTGATDRFGFLLLVGDGTTDTLDKDTEVDHDGNFFRDNNPNWGRERVMYRDNPWTKGNQPHQIVGGERSFSRTEALRTGSGVDIYILDRGVNPNHVEFANNGGRVTNLTDLSGDGDPPSSTDLDQSHGTRVAGAAAGQWCGVATEANIFSVRILDDGDVVALNGVEDGLEVVIAHATGRTNPFVVNLSIQGGVIDTGAQDDINTIIAMGGCVVTIPGNQYEDKDGLSNAYPGLYDNVFVAGGVNVLDLLYYTPHNRSGIGNEVGSSGTGYGELIDVFAPAVNMCLPTNLHNRDYLSGTGTSFAAPTVSGVMACLLQGRSRWSSAAGATAFYDEVKGRCLKRRVKIPGFIDDTTDRMIYLDPLDAP